MTSPPLGCGSSSILSATSFASATSDATRCSGKAGTVLPSAMLRRLCGAMGGALLWFMLTAMLPWGGGTWLAGLAFGGRWNAGEAMMQDASPAQWERMARLCKACPEDSTTELCEAAIIVRTITPGQEGARAPAFGTVPAQPRSNTGLRH